MNQYFPQVSILMPAYNAEKYIQQSIKSVMEQTFNDWELIIFLDGATDKTKSLILNFTPQDSRIRLIDHKENQGIVVARNKLLEAATGHLIAWLDADDICHPMRLEKQLRAFQNNPRIDVCASEYCTYEMVIQKFRRRKCYSLDSDLKTLLSIYNPICNSTTMLKSHIAKKYLFRENKIFAEDYDVWCRMASDGVVFHTIQEVLLTYRIHEDQISRKNQIEMNQAFLTSQQDYLKARNIEQVPQKMPYRQRLFQAISLIKRLNNSIRSETGRNGSFRANSEVYARFQYRRNGIFTIFTRSERWLVALYISLLR